MKSILMALAVAAGLHLVTAGTARADEGNCENAVSEQAMDAINEAIEAGDASEGDGKADDVWSLTEIPVYLHVIYDETTGAGRVDARELESKAIDSVNRQFAAQEIPFRLVVESIDYTPVPTSVYQLEQYGADEKELYDQLNVDGLRVLNMYIVGPRPGTGVTGWAEFLFNPALRRGDHVVLRYFPTRNGFSDPMVPVHEVGHWMGLLHTFHFGCGGLAHGDLIWDTSTQADGHHQCAASTDTCGDDNGADPVDNIMGYGTACRARFSDGQIRRMKFLWRTARGGKGDVEVSELEDDASDTQDHAGCSTGGIGSDSGPAPGIAGVLLALALRRRRLRRAR